MLPKQIRKDIQATVAKYTGTNNTETLSYFGTVGGAVLGFGIVLDLATGGTLSLGFKLAGLIVAGSAPFIGGVLLADSIKRREMNLAGQIIKCNAPVGRALHKMETRLQLAFGKACLPHAAAAKKDTFRTLAKAISNDAAKLAPAFKVVNGGQPGYTFIVGRTAAGKPLTLEAALQQLG